MRMRLFGQKGSRYLLNATIELGFVLPATAPSGRDGILRASFSGKR